MANPCGRFARMKSVASTAELPDGPAQDLALALLRMDHVLATAEACEQNDCNRSDGDDLRVVQRALDHSLKEIRAIATGLGVPELDRLSPLEIVRRVAHAHERKTATKVDLDLTKLPEEAALPVKITLYRLVQEALSNAFRHAHGAGQRVQVRALAGQLDVEVSDTGAGFVRTDATGAEEHLGLVGMRERVESLGGRFRIESRLGRGTRVIAQLPLQVETAIGEP